MKESNRTDMVSGENPRKWIFLSYPMSADTPAYGDDDGAVIAPMKQILSGDSCNTGHWSFPNHLGTHLDFPKHFVRHGRDADDFSADFFVFKKVAVFDLGDVNPGEIISKPHLEGNVLPRDLEMLLIRTGFYRMRKSPVYWRNNPGFSPDLADYFRRSFPGLRVLGFDSISLSSFAHRELGREAHRRFLEEPYPILPLEDMDLEKISGATRFRRLIVAPWMVSKADAVPCTVMANLNDGILKDET